MEPPSFFPPIQASMLALWRSGHLWDKLPLCGHYWDLMNAGAFLERGEGQKCLRFER